MYLQIKIRDTMHELKVKILLMKMNSVLKKVTNESNLDELNTALMNSESKKEMVSLFHYTNNLQLCLLGK